MSGNNASLYERDDSSYTAPSKQLGGNSLYDAAGAAIDKPIDYKGLGLKSKQIVEGSGPLQPPIGQTISGATKDVLENGVTSDVLEAVGIAGGLYGLKKLWDKFGPNDNNTPPPPPPGGPAAPPAAGPVAPTQPQMSPLEQQKLRILELKAQREELALQGQQDKLAREKANYEAKQAQQAAKAKQAGGGTLTESEMKMLSASETAKISKAVIADQKAQQAAAATQQAQAAVAPVAAPAIESGAISTETAPAAKGPVKPKEKATFKSIAEIPEGMVFRPDVGNLDRSLANILGPEHRLYAKELINEGKMFGHSTDVNKDVSRITNEYFKALQGEVPETILSREARKAQGVESKLGTYGKVLGKAAKVGGVAGTLMTIAQSANAKEAANALGEAFLPLGATPSELQPGTLTAKQLKAFEEAKKLGSPYRSVPPPTR